MITLKELERISASRGDMPADEWAALLESCPEWVEKENARRVASDALRAKYRAEQELLLADLRKVGYRIESVWDFVNTAESYSDAIPVLLNHLRRPYSDRFREGIARALAVREARGTAGQAIVKTLRETEGADPQFRWALANALTTVATRAEREDIQSLIEAETSDMVRDRLRRALKTAAKA